MWPILVSGQLRETVPGLVTWVADWYCGSVIESSGVCYVGVFSPSPITKSSQPRNQQQLARCTHCADIVSSPKLLKREESGCNWREDDHLSRMAVRCQRRWQLDAVPFHEDRPGRARPGPGHIGHDAMPYRRNGDGEGAPSPAGGRVIRSTCGRVSISTGAQPAERTRKLFIHRNMQFSHIRS